MGWATTDITENAVETRNTDSTTKTNTNTNPKYRLMRKKQCDTGR